MDAAVDALLAALSFGAGAWFNEAATVNVAVAVTSTVGIDKACIGKPFSACSSRRCLSSISQLGVA